MEPRILVTGATGFVGRTLISTLPADSVQAVVRSASNLEPGCTAVVVPTIDADTDWHAALANVGCVVHLAAHVHVMNPTLDDRKRFNVTNVLGTARLAEMAAAANVKRFIFLSSIKVNGEATGITPFRHDDLPHPVDDYGISKWHAEQRLFEIALQSGMEVIVIRPPLIYGPGVRANFLRLMNWAHKRVPLPFGAIQNKRSLVNVWNVCDLIKHVVKTPSLTSGVVMVSDGEDVSTPDLVRRISHALGRSARLFSVPEKILALAGAVVGKGAEIERLCGSLTVDISDTTRQLGWMPPVSIEEGLARTARWFVDEVANRET